MEYRQLGRTGYQVSEIGHGTWGIGRSEWLDGDDDAARRALRASLELGVTFFDTAYVYGDGHSERIVAGALRDHGDGDGIVVATKIPPRNLVWPAPEGMPIREAFPARSP